MMFVSATSGHIEGTMMPSGVQQASATSSVVTVDGEDMKMPSPPGCEEVETSLLMVSFFFLYVSALLPASKLLHFYVQL